MKEALKVSIWGFGAMGSGIAEVLLRKKGVEITGVCDMHPDRVGKSIFSVLGVERGDRKDVIVTPDIEEAIKGSRICMICTNSFTKDVF